MSYGRAGAIHEQLRHLISVGEYYRAFDLASVALDAVPKDPELLKDMALCQARLGMPERAIRTLAPLSEGGMDSEVAGLLGSFHKTIWLERRGDDAHLERATELYLHSHELAPGIWNGINAATLLTLGGHGEEASSLAGQVIERCWSIYNRRGTESHYWTLATMAEAHLITGDVRGAVEWYGTSARYIRNELGNTSSTLRNAALLMEALEMEPRERERISLALPRLRIGLIEPVAARCLVGGYGSRYPEPSRRKLTDLRRSLARLGLDICISASGDALSILVMDLLQQMNRRTYLILPTPLQHFRALIGDSSPEWTRRFDKVVGNASGLEVTSLSRFSAGVSALYRLTRGYATLYAAQMADMYGGSLVGLSIRAGNSGAGAVGSERTWDLGLVEEWEAVQLDLEPSGSRRREREPEDVPLTTHVACALMACDLGCTEQVTEEEITRRDRGVRELLASAGSGVSILGCGIVGDRLHAALRTPGERAFPVDLLRGASDISGGAVLLHADVATRSAGDDGVRCRSTAACISALDSLDGTGVYCTMQALALLAPESPSTAGKYRGILRTKEGVPIHIYRLETDTAPPDA